jgi:hypothetical protein
MSLKENAQAFVMSALELNELEKQFEEQQENKFYVKLSKCELSKCDSWFCKKRVSLVMRYSLVK